MIARIVPIRRLPAHLQHFDYAVPPTLQRAIRVGHLVTIPFRQSKIFGLVLALRDEQHETSKPIEAIYASEPLFASQHIHLMERVASIYGVSLAVIAKIMLPPLQKRKLKQTTFTNLTPTRPDKKVRSAFTLYTDEEQHRENLQDSVNGTTLILVPEVQYIEQTFTLLSAEQREQTVTWHSQLSTKEQFAHWVAVRNGEKTIIVGTRGACFLPFPQLDTIIIDYEYHEQHKHWDQAPRFHAKDIAAMLAHDYGASLHLMSYTPSCTSYYAVHKKQMRGSLNDISPRTDGLHLVDMSEERRAGRFALLSDTAKEAMRASTGDIFLFMQRRGFSTSVGCNQCGFIATCNTCNLPFIFHESTKTLQCHYCQTSKPLVQACPTCRMTTVILRGAGTEFLESGVRTFFDTDDSKDIIRIDGDLHYAPREDTTRPRVIVGTAMALPHIRWSKTDTIICVDIDKQLIVPEYLAAEHVWHLLAEMNYRKGHDAQLYIQTANPKHTVLRGLTEPDRFYRTELNARKSLGYAPYRYIVRYFYGGTSAQDAHTEARALHKTLSSALTKKNIQATISLPVEMHPRYFRKKFWYTFIIKLDPTSAATDIQWLHQFVPSTWKIDPNPTSILQP